MKWQNILTEQGTVFKLLFVGDIKRHLDMKSQLFVSFFNFNPKTR